LLAALLLAEPMAPRQWAGAALLALAMVLLVRQTGAAKPGG
jgi:DME family drug/metabolite transporter